MGSFLLAFIFYVTFNVLVMKIGIYDYILIYISLTSVSYIKPVFLSQYECHKLILTVLIAVSTVGTVPSSYCNSTKLVLIKLNGSLTKSP